MYQHSFTQEDCQIIRTGWKQHEKQIRWSFEKKKGRRYQAECEEENDLSLVFRGCGDSHEQSPLSTGPSSLQLQSCRAADNKLKQVFSTSYFKVHATAARWKVWDPHAEGAEEENRVVLQPLPGTHPRFPPRRAGREEGAGKEKALVHSHACPGTRLRFAPTRPPELWSPLGPPA